MYKTAPKWKYILNLGCQLQIQHAFTTDSKFAFYTPRGKSRLSKYDSNLPLIKLFYDVALILSMITCLLLM